MNNKFLGWDEKNIRSLLWVFPEIEEIFKMIIPDTVNDFFLEISKFKAALQTAMDNGNKDAEILLPELNEYIDFIISKKLGKWTISLKSWEETLLDYFCWRGALERFQLRVREECKDFSYTEDEKKLIIERMRNEFPKAAKKYDHLFTNKTFQEDVNNSFIWDIALEWAKKEILSKKDPLETPFVHTCILLDNFLHFLTECRKIYWEYFLHRIVLEFYIDHWKKEKRAWATSNPPSFNPELPSILIPATNKKQLSSEQSDSINKVVKELWIKDKEEKEVKHYLTRLCLNNKPLKITAFLQKFQLDSLSDETIELIKNLNLSIEYPLSLETPPPYSETPPETPQEMPSKQPSIIKQTIEDSSLEWPSENNDAEKGDFERVLNQFKSKGYLPENEKEFRDQFESFSWAGNNPTVLDYIFRETFRKPQKKKRKWSLYSLSVGKNRRIVLQKQDNEEFPFLIKGLYNHNDYEKIIDNT